MKFKLSKRIGTKCDFSDFEQGVFGGGARWAGLGFPYTAISRASGVNDQTALNWQEDKSKLKNTTKNTHRSRISKRLKKCFLAWWVFLLQHTDSRLKYLAIIRKHGSAGGGVKDIFLEPLIMTRASFNTMAYLSTVAEHVHPLTPIGSDGCIQQDDGSCHKSQNLSDWFLEHDNVFIVHMEIHLTNVCNCVMLWIRTYLNVEGMVPAPCWIFAMKN